MIVTGHSAFYSEDSAAKYRQRIVDAVASVAKGMWPDWLLNPEVKDRFPNKLT